MAPTLYRVGIPGGHGYYQIMVRLIHLLRRRLEAGLTQDELAARAGRSRFAISQIEQLRTEPRVTTIRRLADALECSPGDLMEGPTAPTR